MTPQDEHRPTDRDDRSSDAIERLLRAAGSRPVGDAERTRRVREAVHGAWRDSLQQHAFRRRLTLGTFALAAAAAVVLAVSLARRAQSPAPAQPPTPLAARLTAATGSIAKLDEARAPVRVGDAAVVGSAFETGSGVLATFALSGGGEVRLNEGTVV